MTSTTNAAAAPTHHAHTTAQLIDRYEQGGRDFASLAQGISPAQLDTRIAPGTWSVREVLVHLLDSDLAATHRMRRIAAEDLPLMIAYDETAFVARLRSSEMNLAHVQALFAANRAFTAAWLRTLTPEDFTRAGIHNQRGRVTLHEMLNMYINHLAHHTQFIEGKLASLNKLAR
ncbi:MAG: DinB family protein [Phycisphaerales bacterium]|nr:DinB family protein [Phycisphaerales bacterium]